MNIQEHAKKRLELAKKFKAKKITEKEYVKQLEALLKDFIEKK